ncbi:kinase-like domain-containing protein [Glomus cerebriforme]|uniref:Kinase-like domain-containing protein n=1 Tax=Glomus cerebriforme TaxID=658196 RepID=A0A397T2T5_9GLOM|nr:kinase-like domain-containing protein [Glomus cerebriforme]
MTIGWCINCDVERLLNDNRWTSGDERIDNFIKHTQKNAKDVWMEGSRWNYDEATREWISIGPTKVDLKRLDDSQNLSQQFINRLFKYFKCLQSSSLADYYGITHDGTSCIMIIMKFYENGNLYSYLDSWAGYICWRDMIDILWLISSGLQKIHNLGLVHGNIHGGNILLEENENTSQTCYCLKLPSNGHITDSGLIGPSFKPYENKIFGVVPFIAPEILSGYEATKASDIYSFGILMDRAHDKTLIYNIFYLKLMKKCLNRNPFTRPTACELNEAFARWVTAVCDDPEPSDLSNQFDKAEDINFLNLQSTIQIIFDNRDLTNIIMSKSRL